MPIIKVEHFGGPDVLQLIDKPDPVPADGQLLVTVKAAGVNFADVAARAGRYPGVPSAPFYPGLETAGIVSKVGPGVYGYVVGDRVIGLLRGGGYASAAILDASSAAKLPDSLDFSPASSLLVQGLTAYFLLHYGKSGPGKTVLISSAAGGLGSLAIQLAKLDGAKVIGLASKSKHERVKELGADFVVDYTQPGWFQEVLSVTDGKGVDLYLDSSGDLAGEGFDTLGAGSHWLIYGGQGAAGKPLVAQKLGQIIGKSITLRGYTLYSDIGLGNVASALSKLLDLAELGKLRIDVQSFPLDKAAEAHIAIESRKTSGKVVLIP